VTFWRRRRGRERPPDPPPWVAIAVARHQPEADLIVNMLREADVPAYHRRTIGFDVPDFVGFGAREVLVRADRADEARALLDPFDWRPARGEPR
jgi:hypothetical protein